MSSKNITIGWHTHTERLADDSSCDQIARRRIPDGNSQRDESGRDVSPTAGKQAADLVDSIPRCYQSNQCGGKESSFSRSIDGGRTVASMRTEEDDLPSGPASQRQDCGSVIHPRRRASGVKGLSKMTTMSRKLGNVRLAKLERYQVVQRTWK